MVVGTAYSNVSLDTANDIIHIPLIHDNTALRAASLGA